jgi:hypothetical protein
MAHPERWGIDGGKLRPALGHMRVVPGLDGIESGGPGEGPRLAQARLNREDRGWTIIPPTVLPPSQAHRGSYLTRLDSRPDVTLWYWVETFAGSREMRRDDALYYEWVDYCVSSGAIPPCQDYVIERLLIDARRQLAKAEDKAKVAPSAAVTAERLVKEIAILEHEMAARLAARVPASASPVGVDLGAAPAPRKGRS